MPKRKRRTERPKRRKPVLRNRDRKLLGGAVRQSIEEFAASADPNLSEEEFTTQALEHVEGEFAGYRGIFRDFILEQARKWIPLLLEAWLGGLIG